MVRVGIFGLLLISEEKLDYFYEVYFSCRMKPLMSPLRGSVFSMLIVTWNDRFSRALFYSFSL